MRELNVSISNHNEEKLLKMIRSNMPHVRLEAAGDSEATDEVLSIALQDANVDVRLAAAGNFWASEHIMLLALRNSDKRVSSAAASNNFSVDSAFVSKHWKEFPELIENANTDGETLDLALGHNKVSRYTIARHANALPKTLRKLMQSDGAGITLLVSVLGNKNADLSVFLLGLKSQYETIRNNAKKKMDEYRKRTHKFKEDPSE